MEFGPSLFCDQLSGVLVEVEACNFCSLDPPTNPVVTACDHCFCWNCMHQYLQGQAKPCPVCSTVLSSDVNVAPEFDDHGALVLHLPTAAEEVELKWDDDMLGWPCTAAAFASAPARSEEDPTARRGADDMAAVECVR